MSFEDLDLKLGYDSDDVDISEEFYKPVLSKSILYKRLSGYFSSSTFAIIVKEILEFSTRGGKIQLVTSPEMSEKDYEIINEAVNGNVKKFEGMLIEKISEESNSLFRDCNSIMGWLLHNQINGEPQLEIKIAIPTKSNGELSNNSIFHQKVGIFFDQDNNKISFEGSVNETGSGWKGNIERFKISTSWKNDIDNERVNMDIDTFEKFWKDEGKRTKVIKLPEAVKNELIKIRPKSTEEYNKIIGRLQKELISNTQKFTLRNYQQDAIKSWVENQYKGIFEMATASGKTFTALGAINEILKDTNRITVIISVPYTHLVEQWSDEFERFKNNFTVEDKFKDIKIQKCYGEINNWKSRVDQRIRDINEKDTSGNYFLNIFLIFTTHSTLSSKNFIELTSKINSDIMIIVDEVHSAGSELRSMGLQPKFKHRLGLSATPDRYFDDEGTKKLINYFDKTVFEFTIGDAIKKNYLSKYEYHPEIVPLSDDEFVKYKELTAKIARKLAVKGLFNDETEISSFIEGERASIIAAAESKYFEFERLLDKLMPLKHCLIYCHSKQLQRVNDILYERNIVFHQITYREPTETRIEILKSLSNEMYSAVVAVNCLDEGVDIPSASVGIILASSGNPRQYIQRRGRLLRKAEGKTMAKIYDILVVPFLNRNPDDVTDLERKIVHKELIRYDDFIKFADNRDHAKSTIDDIRKKYL
jgi:superfamily II DNA or RNA helicase